MRNRGEVEQGVAHWVVWWLNERRKKLVEQLSDSMSVNPFLLPLLFEFHGLTHFGQLSDLVVSGHLYIGHATGFGKLIDEKILPSVFGTAKLGKAYRASNPPLNLHVFDEIDHIVTRPNGSRELLSLKAGKWTIQLTMAVQLNAAFNSILRDHPAHFSNIVVGVFYGNADGLTDKYDILRGINRGAHHNVIDLTNNVHVYAGRMFWAWLNEGEPATQDWVLAGIERGIELHRQSEERQPKKVVDYLREYADEVRAQYDHFIDPATGAADWNRVLTSING